MGKEGKPAVPANEEGKYPCVICGKPLPQIEGIRFHAWHMTD